MTSYWEMWFGRSDGNRKNGLARIKEDTGALYENTRWMGETDYWLRSNDGLPSRKGAESLKVGGARSKNGGYDDTGGTLRWGSIGLILAVLALVAVVGYNVIG